MYRMTKIFCGAAVLALAGCSGTLLPSSAPGEQNMVVAPDLQNYTWRLVAVTGPGSAPLQPAANKLVLNFLTNNNVNVQGLCNTLLGRYAQNASNLNIQPLASTMMACPDQQGMQLEHKLAQQLPQAQTWQFIAGDPAQIKIVFANQQSWLLDGTVKSEAIYGKPDIVFLEVAAQDKPCSHPLQPQARCLQVRKVVYDAQGLKKEVGSWENFYDAIDGYVHEPGVRSILRLKRFTNQHAPADASRYVYELDMVVESSTQN